MSVQNQTNAENSVELPLWLSRCIKAAVILSILTVVNSAYIRLMESGVGCEPWPACYGEYNYNVNSQGVNVLTPKAKDSTYTIERISHRLVATSLGFVVLAIFWASRKKYQAIIGRKVPNLLAIVTVVLSIIGNFHPTEPQPLLNISNFTGGLMLVALSAMLYYKINPTLPEIRSKEDKSSIQKFILLGAIIVGLQIFWGGWTSANFSGNGCQALLECELAEALPDNYHASGAFGPLNMGEGNEVVMEPKMSIFQLIHHILAIITLPYFILLVFWVRKSQDFLVKKLSKDCMMILGLVVGQFLLGLIAVEFGLPILIMAGHSLLGALMVMYITFLNMKMAAQVRLN